MELTVQHLSFLLVIGTLIDIFVIFCFYKLAKHKYKAQAKPLSWYKVGKSNEIHTIPIDDIHPHTPTTVCGCSPQTLPMAKRDGSLGWSVVHNALDGRPR